MDRAKLRRSALVWSAGGGLRRAFFRWKEWHTRRVRLRFAVWHLVKGGVMLEFGANAVGKPPPAIGSAADSDGNDVKTDSLGRDSVGQEQVVKSAGLPDYYMPMEGEGAFRTDKLDRAWRTDKSIAGGASDFPPSSFLFWHLTACRSTGMQAAWCWTVGATRSARCAC